MLADWLRERREIKRKGTEERIRNEYEEADKKRLPNETLAEAVERLRKEKAKSR